MTYQPPSGNGSQPLPQTYPRVPSAPTGPSPQQAQPIPPPLATTPPPDYYPTAAQQRPVPPAPSGPPMLRELQGQLGSPLPIILAGLGLLAMALAFFLPLAEYTWQGKPTSDPLRDFAMYGDSSQFDDIMLSGGDQPTIILLPLAVAVTIALAASRRWLLFGKLATIGLGVITLGHAFGSAYNWQTRIHDYLGSSKISGDGYEEHEGPMRFTQKIIDDMDYGFSTGLWLLLAGVALLVAAALVIRTRPATHPGYAAPMPQRGGYPPQAGYGQAPHVAQQRYQAQQQQSAPQPTAAAGGDSGRDVVVHDDPPSLSIYKPPKKDG